MAQTLDTKKYQSKNPIKNFFIRRFQEQLLTLVKSTGANRVLDAGCGEGYLLNFLDGQIKNWHLEGFDINEKLVDKAKDKLPSVNLSVRDIYNSGYPNEDFNLVLATEVLEHLQYPEIALNEIKRLTKRWAILSVPNEPLFTISDFLARSISFKFNNNPGHHNKWSAEGFVNLISEYFRIHCAAKPFPWIIVLCEKIAK